MALYLCTHRQHGQYKALEPAARDATFDRLWRAMAETHPPSKHFRGWYSFPGELAGIVLIEVASVEEIGAIIRPWGEVSDWTVQEIVPIDYRETDAQVASRAATRS